MSTAISPKTSASSSSSPSSTSSSSENFIEINPINRDSIINGGTVTRNSTLESNDIKQISSTLITLTSGHINENKDDDEDESDTSSDKIFNFTSDVSKYSAVSKMDNNSSLKDTNKLISNYNDNSSYLYLEKESLRMTDIELSQNDSESPTNGPIIPITIDTTNDNDNTTNDTNASSMNAKTKENVKIYQAAEDGDIGTVRRLIAEKVDINEVAPVSTTLYSIPYTSHCHHDLLSIYTHVLIHTQ